HTNATSYGVSLRASSPWGILSSSIEGGTDRLLRKTRIPPRKIAGSQRRKRMVSRAMKTPSTARGSTIAMASMPTGTYDLASRGASNTRITCEARDSEALAGFVRFIRLLGSLLIHRPSGSPSEVSRPHCFEVSHQDQPT